MTDKEINDLAREYAIPLCDEPCDLSDRAWNGIVSEMMEPYKEFLQWLSARYAIVEKSKLTEMYLANNRLKAGFPDSDISKASDQINHCLDCLFPELFKDEEK